MRSGANTNGQIIKSERHQRALEHALNVIRNSPISPYVVSVYLFGSCARQTETWDSDVDLLMELHPSVESNEVLRRPLRVLKSNVTSDRLADPEVDLKIVVGNEWRSSTMTFFENVRRDGILLRV